MLILATLGAFVAAVVSYFWNQSTRTSVDSFFTSTEFQSAVSEAKARNVSVRFNEDTFTLSKSVKENGGFSYLMMTGNYQIESEEDKHKILEAIRSFGQSQSAVRQLQEYQ